MASACCLKRLAHFFASAKVSTLRLPEVGANSPHALPQNSGVRRRRRVRGDFGRRRHRGIKHEYKESGLSVGHGGRRFGRHMKHGRPLHAGAAFGRGMGGFGYDPLFFSPELGMTFAEAGVGPKSDLSHRARAMRAMKPQLLAYLQQLAEQ